MFESIVQFMSQSGYLGVFALMALENIFPPIPSEMIMPLAGFTAARGELNIIAVLIAGTAGSVIGTLPWYYAGRLYGKERLKNLASRRGRWLTVAPDDIGNALNVFQRHGRKAVFFGRLVPAIRTLISVPAGIAKMPLPQYLVYSTAGSVVWTEDYLLPQAIYCKPSMNWWRDTLTLFRKASLALSSLYIYTGSSHIALQRPIQTHSKI